MTAEKPSVALGVRRGLAMRCPHCGEGRLFRRFLKVSDGCETCGADNTIYPSDDAPAYLTMLAVGHLVVPFIFWTDKVWAPAMWVMLAIWLPLIAAISIATLPFVKGATIGYACATGVTRESVTQ